MNANSYESRKRSGNSFIGSSDDLIVAVRSLQVDELAVAPSVWLDNLNGQRPDEQRMPWRLERAIRQRNGSRSERRMK
jgi:hypothetical protein